MKLLHAEDGGMVMYVKRLEAGRFKLPEYDENTQSYQMEWRDLVVMVEGIQESPDQRLVLFHYDQGSRAGAVIESLANRYNFKDHLCLYKMGQHDAISR